MNLRQIRTQKSTDSMLTLFCISLETWASACYGTFLAVDVAVGLLSDCGMLWD
ncbi:hypothetical protein Ancab_010560 [Ancistrocladus abbreviatus]